MSTRIVAHSCLGVLRRLHDLARRRTPAGAGQGRRRGRATWWWAPPSSPPPGPTACQPQRDHAPRRRGGDGAPDAVHLRRVPSAGRWRRAHAQASVGSRHRPGPIRAAASAGQAVRPRPGGGRRRARCGPRTPWPRELRHVVLLARDDGRHVVREHERAHPGPGGGGGGLLDRGVVVADVRDALAGRWARGGPCGSPCARARRHPRTASSSAAHGTVSPASTTDAPSCSTRNPMVGRHGPVVGGRGGDAHAALLPHEAPSVSSWTSTIGGSVEVVVVVEPVADVEPEARRAWRRPPPWCPGAR